MSKYILCTVLVLVSINVWSEDIELYLQDATIRAETKPQVLLLVDTSGSMEFPQTIKTPFDSSETYHQLEPGFSGDDDDYIYYVVGSPDVLPTVDSPTETRRFLQSKNNCNTSKSRLDSAGFYTGRIRHYAWEGSVGSWQQIHGSDGSTVSIIDCEDDINLDLAHIADSESVEHNENKVGTNTILGYPIDGAGMPASPVYYDDITKADANWTGDIVTLYTDEYLRWEQGTHLANDDEIGETVNTRLEIAKRTLKNLINSIPSVNFGLEVYNINLDDEHTPSGHGGRIVFGMQDINDTSLKAELIADIDQMHASGSTPLCESYYEAYRYFSATGVLYGNSDYSATVNPDGPWTSYHDETLPARDLDIEDSGNYKNAYGECSNKVFVILITDGIPQNDSDANSYIEGLKVGADPAVTATPIDIDGTDNYLPVLAQYMSTNDINDNLDDIQTAELYTVGFSEGSEDAETLLRAAAHNGGGEYYDASDPTKLGSKLQEAISSILSVNTSFTAPSVATNSFDRTETLDSVYYAMFLPTDRAKWGGNLKKLRLEGDSQVDRVGDAAIDAESGNISSSAKTFWSTVTDGNDVSKGGVVDMFINKTDARKVMTDIGDATSLIELTYSNLESDLGSEALTNTLLGVTDTDEAKEYLNWGLGIESVSSGESLIFTYRDDLLGDPLHSKPVTINYGGTAESQDVRILLGTNAGVLHMFKDSGATVDESWAFMPQEFLPNIKTLRDNLPSSSKVYGVDGRITTFINDKNGDGTINKDEDTVLAFFGLRRGGNSYYALDLSNPNTPDLKWKIDANTPGFEELGQTWSQPQIAYSKLNIEEGEPKPVLIFGGGYSISKDLAGPGSGSDPIGRAIYMVDADTGGLLWSLTPEASGGKNTQFTGLTDSIPSRIAVLDSDGDGLVDRLYTGDTGGNIYRIDMPGNEPLSSDTPWTAFKLAELGGAAEAVKTNLNDRRFFDQPSIVRTFFTDTTQSVTDTETFYQQETPYDAILIGSGDRATPTSTDTNDEFFMIQDMNVVTQSFEVGATAPAKDIPTLITYDDLYDFTSNPYGETLSTAERNELDAAVSEESGWRVNYASPGEKSTASAIAINGVAYFTSFTPGAESADVCQLAPGNGGLYAIDLYKGTNIYGDRFFETFDGIPDTPQVTVPSTPDFDPTAPADPASPYGINKSNMVLLTGGKAFPINATLSTSRSYQYITEN